MRPSGSVAVAGTETAVMLSAACEVRLSLTRSLAVVGTETAVAYPTVVPSAAYDVVSQCTVELAAACDVVSQRTVVRSLTVSMNGENDAAGGAVVGGGRRRRCR